MPTPYTLCALGLALGLPSLAHAAPADANVNPGAAADAGAGAVTNAGIVAAAKASPLFKKEVVRKNLKRQGLAKVRVREGIDMDLQAYVEDTGLDKQPQTAPLFDAKLRPAYLTTAPTYKETIVVLEDRFVVDRIMTVPLLPGACDDAAAPQVIADLCFVENKGNKASKAVNADLKKIRAELSKADPGKIIRGTLTAKQALDMDDKTLLGTLLNSDTRTIHHTSIIPRVGVDPTPTPALGKLDTAIVPSTTDTGLVKQMSMGAPADVAQVGDNKTFETRYFLTGFTYGRQIEDAWEYTIAGETWLTDRYYVRLAYHLSFGFGVRAPFSIGVKSTANGGGRRVDVSVAPVDVDTQGNPAYPAVGLPANKTFEGKEFVLEFKAGCSFYASVPGPNVDKQCPSIDKGYSRDVNPVIGSESSQIHDWWLDGTVTGLSINFAVVKATLDLGVGADVTNGRIRMRATGINGGTVSGLNAGALAFSNRDAIGFDVTNGGGQANAGLRLDDPRYGFDLRLRPKLRGKIDLDVAVYEKQWIIGPFALDFLAIAQNFQLGHHAGTVANHDYAVFDTGLVFDPGISDPGTPPPKKPPKVKKPPVAKPDVLDPNP